MKWIKSKYPNLTVFYLFAIGVFSVLLPVNKVSANYFEQQQVPLAISDTSNRINTLKDSVVSDKSPAKAIQTPANS